MAIRRIRITIETDEFVLVRRVESPSRQQATESETKIIRLAAIRSLQDLGLEALQSSKTEGLKNKKRKQDDKP